MNATITVPATALHDKPFYGTSQLIVGDLALVPVHVTGNCMLSHFSGWPGVAYSQHDFTMKAFRDQNGNIYRPARSHNEERGCIRNMVRVAVEECYVKPIDLLPVR